jgi:hypothetical protein
MQVAVRTERYLEQQRLYGWDPYDALSSPLFCLPLLRSNRPLRFASQQLVKRVPWNVRPALRIPKQLNPVSIALYLQGLAHLAAADPSSAEARGPKARAAIEQLAGTVSSGYAGSCWGYPFDWETRYGSIPSRTPTVVATGIVTNSLYKAFPLLGAEQARELIISAAEFVVSDLNRIAGEGEEFCWSYSPLDRQAVLNATLKGSRLLAQAVALGAPAELLEDAAQSASFVVARQHASGAWPYAAGDARTWADNFHTGYVLECLSAYRQISGDRSVDEAIARGWNYYRQSFFTTDFTAKYYDQRVEPIDATACAQAIITLCEFGDLSAAAEVAERSLDLLGQQDGSIAYQRRHGRTLRTPFLRWSSAWMYCALGRLAQDSARNPKGSNVSGPQPAEEHTGR